MTRFRAAVFLLALAFVEPARGADPGDAGNPTPTPEAKRSFLWLRNIDGFNTIDDQHIVLNSGSKRALVTTFGPCFGLRDSETIAIDAPLDYLDGSGLGNIVYRRLPGDRGRCPIDKIVAVDSLKAAKDLVAKEKAEKAKKAEAGPKSEGTPP